MHVDVCARMYLCVNINDEQVGNYPTSLSVAFDSVELEMNNAQTKPALKCILKTDHQHHGRLSCYSDYVGIIYESSVRLSLVELSFSCALCFHTVSRHMIEIFLCVQDLA